MRRKPQPEESLPCAFKTAASIWNSKRGTDLSGSPCKTASSASQESTSVRLLSAKFHESTLHFLFCLLKGSIVQKYPFEEKACGHPLYSRGATCSLTERQVKELHKGWGSVCFVFSRKYCLYFFFDVETAVFCLLWRFLCLITNNESAIHGRPESFLFRGRRGIKARISLYSLSPQSAEPGGPVLL